MSRALARLRDTGDADLGPFRSIELRPGIVMLPLATPTLPPATHTNAFLLGREHAVLVDPATPYDDEQARLVAALEVARSRGVRLAALWLTHHHRDHTGAVASLRERFGVPVLAHPEAAPPLAAQGIALDGHLEDGQRHALGGVVPLTVRVVHTPGHTRGHIALLDERTATVLCGDLVSALSTIVIDPPEGDMDDYLASLERVAALEPALLLPAHGPPIADPGARLAWYRDHRLEREAEVLAAWRAGTRDAEAMIDGIYPDLAPPLRPVARRQLEAHLIRLRRRGELDRAG